MAYGSYIRAARERRDKSREETARAIGYKDADMLRKIERDAANISFDKLERLAEFLGEPIGDLLPNSGGNPTDDLFQPLLAAMAGLAPADMQEFVNDLAIQAKINRRWGSKNLSSVTPSVRPGKQSGQQEPRDDGETIDPNPLTRR